MEKMDYNEYCAFIENDPYFIAYLEEHPEVSKEDLTLDLFNKTTQSYEKSQFFMDAMLNDIEVYHKEKGAGIIKTIVTTVSKDFIEEAYAVEIDGEEVWCAMEELL